MFYLVYIISEAAGQAAGISTIPPTQWLWLWLRGDQVIPSHSSVTWDLDWSSLSHSGWLWPVVGSEIVSIICYKVAHRH